MSISLQCLTLYGVNSIHIHLFVATQQLNYELEISVYRVIVDDERNQVDYDAGIEIESNIIYLF